MRQAAAALLIAALPLRTPAQAAVPPPAPTAPVPAAAEPSSAPEQRYAEGTLWRLTAASGRVAHLLGTIHLGRPDELAVPPQAWQLLRGARQLVVELAQDTLDARQLERLQRLPPPTTLARQLTPSQVHLLRDRLARSGLPADGALRYRPWVLTQWLQAGGQLAPISLDDQLVLVARQAGIEVRSLETLAEQFGAFECISPAEQALLLTETLATKDDFFDHLNREALAQYRAQRIGALVEALDRGFPTSAAARAAEARATACTVTQRNERFMQRLQPLLDAGDVFVAVGAAHLVGRDGLLARLAAGGYRIERVTADSPDTAPAVPVAPVDATEHAPMEGRSASASAGTPRTDEEPR